MSIRHLLTEARAAGIPGASFTGIMAGGLALYLIALCGAALIGVCCGRVL